MKNLGKFTVLGVALVSVAVLSLPKAFASSFTPYDSVGTQITSDPVITANGSVSLYFYGFSADDTDYVNIIDVTSGLQSGFIFDNKTTTPGQQVNVATNAGDTLVIELYDASTGSYFYSGSGAAPSGALSCVGAATSLLGCTTTAAASEEMVDHMYVTTFTGQTSPAIPAGLLVGVEDLGKSQGSDYDYNDDQFVLVGATIAPEPSSLMLLGTGLTGAAGLFFRRRRTA